MNSIQGILLCYRCDICFQHGFQLGTRQCFLYCMSVKVGKEVQGDQRKTCCSFQNPCTVLLPSDVLYDRTILKNWWLLAIKEEESDVKICIIQTVHNWKKVVTHFQEALAVSSRLYLGIFWVYSSLFRVKYSISQKYNMLIWHIMS